MPLHLLSRIYFSNLTLLFYNIFLLLYQAGIGLVSLWNPKARQWINGRKNILERLHSELKTQNSKLVWVHCSSLGEFEQGRPVIEKIKTQYPNSKLLLTFFSPSGYEIRKDYKGADWVFYLPMDGKANAKRFFDIVDPSLVIFVKYDYWHYYLLECKKRKVPLLMISAIFRKEQAFFKWFGSLQRKMLACFTHFFVQDHESRELLRSININNVSVAGDTRFDRVAEIAENFKPIHEIEAFCKDSSVFIAGSTWPEDERIIKEATNDIPGLKIIIAPHEIHKEHLDHVKKLFPNSIFYSEFKTQNSAPETPNSKLQTYNCLIIDNIGMLSRLYHYATITYIGGGFNKGIHNTLEAAVYGKPVIFGPNYQKFREAKELIKSGGGFSINNAEQLTSLVRNFNADRSALEATNKNSYDFVIQNKGATGKIIGYIEEKRLFTN